MMIEVIFYGRGGQGGVVASKLLASAFFQEGKYVQSFPAFGGERRGAPVKAFLRADDKTIRRRSLIYKADHAILLDETLPEEIPVHNEVKGAQSIVINSSSPPDSFSAIGASCIGTVDANAIAEELGLGSAVMPIVNTIMLGAFAKISKMVDIESISKAIEKNISIKPEDNISGAVRAYKEVKEAKGGVNGQS
jgi:2-oxoacid:acceptor oxidoreductase gamma subunit (pyruvate/2-ketoisovalerate family)